MESKRTLVLGASTNTSRYSYMAVVKLLNYGHEVIPVGIKKGRIEEIEIVNDKVLQKDIDTITLYVGPKVQEEWKEYIKATKPTRVIFNPGTINLPFMQELEREGVEVIDACTLVMLSANTY